METSPIQLYQENPFKKGRLKLFLGILPQTGKALQMLNEVSVRAQSGEHIYVSALNPSFHGEKTAVTRLLKSLNQSVERLETDNVLESGSATEALIYTAPNILALGSILPRKNGDIKTQLKNLQLILESGIDVYACIDTYNIEGVADTFARQIHLGNSNLIFRSTLLAADDIEIVDTSSISAQKALKALSLKRYPIIAEHIKTFVQTDWIEHNRQALLSLALEHATRNIGESASGHKNYLHSLQKNIQTTTLSSLARDTLIALLTVFVCSFIVYILESHITDITQGLKAIIYLTGVVSVALFTGLYAGLLGSFLTYLSYNYFFMQPRYSFEILDFSEVAVGVAFIFSAVLINIMTHSALRKRSKADLIEKLDSNILSDFLDELVHTSNMAIVANILQKTLDLHIGLSNTVYILDEHDAFQNFSAVDKSPSQQDIEHVQSVLENGRDIGVLPAHIWILGTENQTLGAIIFDDTEKNSLFKHKNIVDKLIKIGSFIMERHFLGHTVEDTLMSHEREKLRSALLSSISHDLKTPLVSIVGSLSTVKSYGDMIDKEDRDDLIDSAIAEAKRLNGFISNILDISKIEAGALSLKRGWHPLEDIAHNTIERFKPIMSTAHMHVNTMLKKEASVYVDPVLFGQTVFNLVDNAVKYAGKSAKIAIQIEPEKTGGIFISVIDDGPGLDENAIENLFNKFYRAEKQDSQTGTGLGLAIVRGIMEAHSGEIKAFNRKDEHSGAVFQLYLPKEHVNYD